MSRVAQIQRKTRETDIALELTIDGTGAVEVSTGLGMLDHMLTTLAFFARWDLSLRCSGDLTVDDHHTVEDCALTLGSALDRALGERTEIARFGWAYAPLDEALARAVVDLSGRPWASVDLGLARETLGKVSCENLAHFFSALSTTLRSSLHVDVLRGTNDHHRVEAGFKAAALALRQALTRQDAPGRTTIPSTKGVL